MKNKAMTAMPFEKIEIRKLAVKGRLTSLAIYIAVSIDGFMIINIKYLHRSDTYLNLLIFTGIFLIFNILNTCFIFANILYLKQIFNSTNKILSIFFLFLINLLASFILSFIYAIIIHHQFSFLTIRETIQLLFIVYVLPSTFFNNLSVIFFSRILNSKKTLGEDSPETY